MYRVSVKWISVISGLLLFLGVTACGKTEISDAEHVQNAKQYQVAGDLQATLIELKNALQKNPKNSEARLLLGELYITLGNGVTAEKELVRASALGVKGPYWQKLKGEALLLQNRYDDVLKTIEHLNVDSEIDLLILQARAYAGLGEIEKSRFSYQQALSAQPDDAEALLGLAELELSENDLKGSGDFLARVFAIDPKNVEALVLHGMIQMQREENDAALVSFQQAVDALGSTTLVTRLGMQARTNLAKSLIIKRRYDEAEKYIDYLLRAAPKHPQPNFLAGLLAYEQGKLQESKDYFLKVIRILPNHLPSLFLLGSVNFALGNLEQAEQQLARVVAERPGLLSARMLLANVRLQQAEGDAALEVLEPALAQNPDSVRLLAMAGQAALRSGDLDKSKKYLQKMISKRPNAGGVRAQLAMLYLAEGNDELAIKELEQAIESGKSPAREQSLLALTYLRKKDFDKALVTAQDLSASYPNRAYPQNLLGIILAAKGEITLARGAFAEALKFESEFMPAVLNLARLDVMAGHLAEAQARLDGVLAKDEKNVSAMVALAQLAEATNDQAQALEWLENARAADSKGLVPRLLLARYYSRTGELDRAMEIAREAMAIDDRNPQTLKVLGQVELATKDYVAAEVIFEKLVKEAPKVDTYFLLALAQFNADAVAAARKSVMRVLEFQPNHLQALSLLVLVDVKSGRISEALRSVENLKRRHPKSPAGFLLEGDILASQKQNAKASNAYAKARELGGGTRALLKEVAALRKIQSSAAAMKLLENWLGTHESDVSARYTLAVAYFDENRLEDAIREYRHLLEISPGYAPALNNLAWLFFQKQQFSEAKKLAEKAYDLYPGNGAVLDTLGWIRLHQGDTRQALALLRQAAAKMPESGDVQYHLAEALLRSGKKDEAREILKQALSTDSLFSSRQKAKQLLESF